MGSVPHEHRGGPSDDVLSVGRVQDCRTGSHEAAPDSGDGLRQGPNGHHAAGRLRRVWWQ